ncbi:MAG: Hpt domain-containing protein [Pseudobdellovibrionaceae bacterium]
MTIQKQKLSHVLNELKEEYLKKLPIKIDNLKLLTTAQNWAALEDEYHKLKGTGKTYGFPEISIVCEKLEFLVQQKNHQTVDLFHQANELLAKMHHGYLKKESINLEQDAFARSLLALKLK